MSDFIGCSVKELPADEQVAAAQQAIEINPANRPSPKRILDALAMLLPDLAVATDEPILQPGHLAVMTSKRWPATGAKLTVAFLDSAPADLQQRVVAHLNEWNKHCNISFALSKIDPQVRVARDATGYWAFVGTDILRIPKSQATLNLEGFTMNTPENEFIRVVRHEGGHLCGFPHEHMRSQLVARLDVQKTIAWGRRVLGWNEQMVRQQILTPLNEQSIRGTPNADQDSIMAYQLPAEITKDGQPIRGGDDIDALDGKFAGEIYPLAVDPPPVSGGGKLKITLADDNRSVRVTIA